jgi:hypothetical protein
VAAAAYFQGRSSLQAGIPGFCAALASLMDRFVHGCTFVEIKVHIRNVLEHAHHVWIFFWLTISIEAGGAV